MPVAGGDPEADASWPLGSIAQPQPNLSLRLVVAGIGDREGVTLPVSQASMLTLNEGQS